MGEQDILDSILGLLNAHYAKQSWLAATDFLSLPIEISPNDSVIHGALGSLRCKLNGFTKACASFTTAVNLSPDKTRTCTPNWRWPNCN